MSEVPEDRTTDSEIDALRTLLDSATPTPWSKHDDSRMHVARLWPNQVAMIATMRDIEDGVMGVRSSANRDLIVGAVNALPSLLSRLAAVEREAAEQRARADHNAAAVNANADMIGALRSELADARFRPLGDNHHNAAACPYCSPGGAGLASQLRVSERRAVAAEARIEATEALLDEYEARGDFKWGIMHLRTALAASRPRRHDQCDDTCTVDCGHCKGKGAPSTVNPTDEEKSS